MEKPKPYYLWVLLTTFLFSTILILHQASGLTDPSDVVVLQDLYKSLNQPPQLVGWNLSGGDPCEDSWTGISCSGTSVMFIKLNGLDLNGSLGGNLFNLFNLKQLDVSFNHIEGEIPSSLPPNATHIDLSFNNLNQNIPFSLSSMKYLRHLNLSHNSLSGPVGNVFMGLPNLKRMDLSYNNFTGDLPSSFGSLLNLTGLYLQNNHFTGSVAFLAYLPLTDLNIQNNHFSGIVPKQFENIPNLWFGENAFQIGANYPPWSFPTDNIPTDQNVENFPKAQSNAIESYPIIIDGKQKHRRLTPGAIAFTVGGIALVATCAAALLAIRIKRSHHHKLVHSPLSIATSIGTGGMGNISGGGVAALQATSIRSIPVQPRSTCQLQKLVPLQAAGPRWRNPPNYPTLSVSGSPPNRPVHAVGSTEPCYICIYCRKWIVDVANGRNVHNIFGLALENSIRVGPL
ncbi:hypothetical protein MKW94_016601 [Papaver nudicaule]|uniref:Leucine-rich repeat-containing N-terminal plant-type domain-containing protein n=1 Tax=Papaver nudicaule TaxID=74823 RepID=A0AA41VV64_PAPNU|nr:hypothetical protein [Papaver nudicaule]